MRAALSDRRSRREPGSGPITPFRPLTLSILCMLAVLAGGAAPARAQAPQQPACDSETDPGKPLPADALAGKWTNAANGDAVEIVRKDPKDAGNFALKGKHDWDGNFGDGKLVFTRTPTAEEMEHTAELWARKAVEGQLKWTLEIEPRTVCGTPRLKAKWYRGLIEIDKTRDDNGNVTAQSAKLAGKGEPIEISYERVPPAIYGVVVMSDETAMGADGLPRFPYPFPQPPLSLPPGTPPPLALEATPFLHEKAATGRGDAVSRRRMLYVYGQGLPRDYKRGKIAIAGGAGATGVEYTVEALDTEKANTLSPDDARLLKEGRQASLKNADDPQVRAWIAKADAMLVRVDLHSGVLPGWKDFTIDGIRGNSRWNLRFGDDLAVVSFARDIGFGEAELVNTAFMPERVFLLVKTETALPIDEIPLRVALNDSRVLWNQDLSIAAKLDPHDPTRTTYRTATIELVDQDNQRGPAGPGIVFLRANIHDSLMAWPEDPGLLRYESRKLEIQPSPSALGMTWTDALTRAAKAAGLKVQDWRNLSAKEASLFANCMLVNVHLLTGGSIKRKLQSWLGEKLGLSKGCMEYTSLEDKFLDWYAKEAGLRDGQIFPKGETFGENLRKLKGEQIAQPRELQEFSLALTVGDLAALLLYRDEFVRRMDADVAKLPALDDAAALRALRKKLQPFAWDQNSAFGYIEVSCPGGASCPFDRALDDDFVKQQFGDDQQKADSWILQAMREMLSAYRKDVQAARKKAAAVEDKDFDGLISLLGTDCIPDVTDHPCGYMALRPFLLPRMMRRADVDASGQPVAALKNGETVPPGASAAATRSMWIADLNARFILRNLDIFIRAYKAQEGVGKIDTQVAVAFAMTALGPALSAASAAEEGVVSVLAAILEAPGSNTLIGLATEIPDVLRARQEVKFARGASLVLGTERLSIANNEMTQAMMALANATAQGLLFDSQSMMRVVGEVRTARIVDRLKEEGLKGLKGLPAADQQAFFRILWEAEKLERVSKLAELIAFDRDVSDLAKRMVREGGGGAGETGPPPTQPLPPVEGPPPTKPLPPAEGSPPTKPLPVAEGPAPTKPLPAGEGTPPTNPYPPGEASGAGAGNADVVAEGDPVPQFEPSKPDPQLPANPEPAANGGQQGASIPDDAEDLPVPPAEKKEPTVPLDAADQEQIRQASLRHAAQNAGQPATRMVDVTIDGQQVKLALGKRLGQPSALAETYVLEGVQGYDLGCPNPPGCVVKFLRGPRDLDRNIACYLTHDALGTRQPKIYAFARSSPEGPFLIETNIVKGENIRKFDTHAAFKASPERAQLVAALTKQIRWLADHNVAWSDWKLDNLYWERDNAQAEWQLGTYDPDFTGKFSDRASKADRMTEALSGGREVRASDARLMQAQADVALQLTYVEADPVHLRKDRKSLRAVVNRIDDIIKSERAQSQFQKPWEQLSDKEKASLATNPEEFAQLGFGKRFDQLSKAIQDQFKQKISDNDAHWDYFDTHRGPYTASPEHFMEQMFEDRHWVNWDDAKGQFTDDGMVTVDEIRQQFPKFGLRDRMAPTDVTRPFDKAPNAGQAPPPGGRP